jgi:hypothetical protein
MTPDPAAPSLPGTSLLAFARQWLSPAVVASVLEPLVADWQREQTEARSRRARLRLHLQWTAAFLSAFMLSGLRELAVLPPARLAAGAGARGLLLAGFGFFLQQTFQRPHDVPGLNAALVDSLPFAIVAVVDTIRAATSLPLYHRRLLAIQAVLAASMVLAVFGATALEQRFALALMPVVLGVFGWTMRPRHEQQQGWFSRWVVAITLVASALSISAYPLKWMLGMNLFARWWGGDVMLAVAIATVLHWAFNRSRALTAAG